MSGTIQEGGGTKEQAAREIPEQGSKYPEPGMFAVASAYGLFVRHAKDVFITDVEFSFLKPDYRPAIVFEDINAIDMHNIAVQRTKESHAILLKDATNICVGHSRGVEDQKIGFVNEKAL